MRCRELSLGGVFLVFALSSAVFAADYDLQYFLVKTDSKENGLSKTERAGLLRCIEEVLEQAQRIRGKLIQGIRAGEFNVRYQEGTFWLSKLEEDGGLIETAVDQIRLLRDKPTLLVPTVGVYKALKDLSMNLNAYNNMPSFSRAVGDLAPEMELWADAVFYQLYLLPLARVRDKEMEARPPPKEKQTEKQTEKKPPPKAKKP